VAYCLWVAYYNLRRRHQSLRITPAMEAGMASQVWSIREFGSLLDDPLAHYYSFDIAFAMQNSYDLKGVFFQQIINPDGLESGNRPRPKVLKLGVTRIKTWPDQGMLQ